LHNAQNGKLNVTTNHQKRCKDRQHKQLAFKLKQSVAGGLLTAPYTFLPTPY